MNGYRFGYVYYKNSYLFTVDQNSIRHVPYKLNGLLSTSVIDFSGCQPGIFATSGSPTLSVTGGVMIFTGNGTWDSVRRSETSITDGESVSFAFICNSKAGQTNALIHTGTYGQANYRRYSFEILNGVFQRTTYTGTSMNVVPLMPVNPNTWYMGMLTVGQSGKFQVKIWERDNPAVMVIYNDSFDSSWQYLNWTLPLIICFVEEI